MAYTLMACKCTSGASAEDRNLLGLWLSLLLILTTLPHPAEPCQTMFYIFKVKFSSDFCMHLSSSECLVILCSTRKYQGQGRKREGHEEGRSAWTPHSHVMSGAGLLIASVVQYSGFFSSNVQKNSTLR